MYLVIKAQNKILISVKCTLVNYHCRTNRTSSHATEKMMNKQMTRQNPRKWTFQTHKELKQQVVVWILVLKADGSLFLQMHGVDERYGAFVTVGHQVVSLRQPGRTAVPTGESAVKSL